MKQHTQTLKMPENYSFFGKAVLPLQNKSNIFKCGKKHNKCDIIIGQTYS